MLISPLRIALRTTPALPLPGDKATIMFTVTNAGGVALVSVRPVLTIVSGSAFAGPPAGPVPAAGGTINPNGGVTYTWTVTIGGTGEIKVKAQVTATVTGQGPVSAEAECGLAPPAVPGFSASLAPNPVDVTGGQWFDVVITVSNTGGVRAMEILPIVSPAANANLVVFKSGPVPAKPVSLAPGESAGFAFTYSANGSGTVSFAATVSGRADLTPPGIASRTASSMARKKEALAIWFAATRASATAWIDRTFFPPPPPPPTEKEFIGFETGADLDWETDGYASITPSFTHTTQGERSCAVSFCVPGDLTLTPTGSFKPSIRLAWPPRGVKRALEPHDWTPYLSLRADFYNASPSPLPLTLTLVDVRGWKYGDVRVLPPLGATTFEYGFQPVRDARVDLSRLAWLEFSVETTALSTRPVVYLDNLRFELPPPPPPRRRRRAAATAGTEVSSTSMVGTSRTATGTGAKAR